MNRSMKTTIQAFAGIGALNWGLAIFNINLISLLFASVPVLVTILYAIIGISGILILLEMMGLKV